MKVEPIRELQAALVLAVVPLEQVIELTHGRVKANHQKRLRIIRRVLRKHGFQI